MKIIAFILLLPTLVLGQAFTPTRPFIPFVPSNTNPPPDVLTNNNVFFWVQSNNESGTNIAGASGFPTEGQGIWKWGNDGQKAVGTVRAGDAFCVSCSIPTPSGFIWSGTNGPNGMATVTSWSTAVPYSGACGYGAYQYYTNPLTMFAVIRETNTTTSQFLVDMGDGHNNHDLQILLDYGNLGGGGFRIGQNSSTISAGSIPVMTNWTLLTVCCNGANSFVRTNGNGTNALTFTCPSFNSGSQFYVTLLSFFAPYASLNFRGNCSEFLIFDTTTLATNDLKSVETYLINKWGGTNVFH